MNDPRAIRESPLQSKCRYDKFGGVPITNTDTPPILFKFLFSGSFLLSFFAKKRKTFFAYFFLKKVGGFLGRSPKLKPEI